jgi:UDP-N-acetylglucosamine 1-carboxyvinyltransferase
LIDAPDAKTFVVTGVRELKGARVEGSDLRGGAALIIAGLAARGETAVRGSRYLERGYEKIEDSLRSLGADITLALDD